MKLNEVIEQHVKRMPMHLQSQVLNFVFFLEEQTERATKPDSNPKTRQQHLKKALQNLVNLKTFNNIKDPVAWQRQQRHDRILPTRTNKSLRS